MGASSSKPATPTPVDTPTIDLSQPPVSATPDPSSSAAPSPSPSPSSAAVPAPPPRHAFSATRLSKANMNAEALQVGPHRCASRFDDMAMALMHLNLRSLPTTVRRTVACFRSELGAESREPHINLPPSRLPRWDPAHPQYDPDAPYDSFPKKLGPGQTPQSKEQTIQ